MIFTALSHLFLWFLFYSFVGWVYETILVSSRERRFVNRGFLNGPLCPIYGTGAVMAVVLLRHIDNAAVLFLVSALGASVLEYVTSWGMEKLFHARWWDYSRMRFNINGRVCLLGAVVFGLAGVLIVKFVHPWVASVTAMLPLPVVHWVTFVCFVLVVVDCTVTVAGVMDLERQLALVAEFVQTRAEKAGDSWEWGKDAFGDKLRDWSTSSQEKLVRLRGTVTSVLGRQQQRMIRSFPHFKSVNYGQVVDTIREIMRRGEH
ncbi:transporter [Bifidobacterium lemurum]|uniref:Transporter n=1 Tax=Bifidobacterium lemurum TaxID=1603886 RepID=A0A261FT50_9BIFI|nr:putative ABC transporter permease [Bifidobacterium lemurum]OZG62371.1 transporter [Bifidobacterium lemurum]QOL35459.1 putative ABC transporter permease [Bifidobacterium lemurum]